MSGSTLPQCRLGLRLRHALALVRTEQHGNACATTPRQFRPIWTDCGAGVKCDGHGCGKSLSWDTDEVITPNFLFCEKCLVLGEAAVAAYPVVKLTCVPSCDRCSCDICKVR